MKQLFANLFVGLIMLCATAVQGQQILSVSPEFVDGTTEFSSLQAAVDAAADGGLIYVYPGGYDEAIVIEDKSLYIVGTGYAKEQNYPEVPVRADAYFLQGFTVKGSGSVVLEGLHFRSLTVKNTSNTQVKRSRIQRLWLESCVATFHGIYLSGYTWAGNSNSWEANQIRAFGNINVEFYNSIFPDAYRNPSRLHLLYCNNSTNFGGPLASGTIVFNRCFFRNYLDFTGRVQAIITNCITYSQYGTWQSPIAGSTYSNSIFQTSGTNNSSLLYGVDLDLVFVGWPSNPDGFSFDKRYQIKPNSPASGFATDGGDCGPYGGPNPYVPSGLPAVPLIYNFNAEETGTTGGGLPVNVKVRTQN